MFSRFSNLLQTVAVHAAFLCSFAFSLTGFQAPRPAIAQGTAERVRSPEGMNAIQMQHQLEVLRAQLSRQTAADSSRASLMTEIAYLESRLGLLVEAEESSRSALAMHVHLSPQAIGLNHFILANADNIVGSGAMAVREYLQAVEAFRAAGPSAYLNLAMTYSELAMAYLQAQDLRSAEDSLQKSFAAAPAVETTVPVLDVLRRDTLVHIELKRGRLSDASKTLEKLLQTQ